VWDDGRDNERGEVGRLEPADDLAKCRANGLVETIGKGFVGGDPEVPGKDELVDDFGEEAVE
jgi:hypothetical protein